MDKERIVQIQTALDTDAHRKILKEADVDASELDTIFELALASAASGPGIPGVRITYPSGRTQILTQREWQRLPADVMAAVSAEVLTPREYAEAIKETSP